MMPNRMRTPVEIENDFVMTQLKCFGLSEYKSLMEQCFPTRIEYRRLLHAFNIREFPCVRSLRHRLEQFQLEILLRSAGLKSGDFKLGARVCFRSLSNNILQKILNPKADEIIKTQESYRRKLNALRNWSVFTESVSNNSVKRNESPNLKRRHPETCDTQSKIRPKSKDISSHTTGKQTEKRTEKTAKINVKFPKKISL